MLEFLKTLIKKTKSNIRGFGYCLKQLHWPLLTWSWITSLEDHLPAPSRQQTSLWGFPGRELSTKEPKQPSQNTERRLTDRYLLSTCAESRGYKEQKGLFVTGWGAVQGTTSGALRWAAGLVPGVHQLLAARLLPARLPGKLTLRQKRNQEAEWGWLASMPQGGITQRSWGAVWSHGRPYWLHEGTRKRHLSAGDPAALTQSAAAWQRAWSWGEESHRQRCQEASPSVLCWRGFGSYLTASTAVTFHHWTLLIFLFFMCQMSIEDIFTWSNLGLNITI